VLRWFEELKRRLPTGRTKSGVVAGSIYSFCQFLRSGISETRDFRLSCRQDCPLAAEQQPCQFEKCISVTITTTPMATPTKSKGTSSQGSTRLDGFHRENMCRKNSSGTPPVSDS
jgi:hypothetical protein